MSKSFYYILGVDSSGNSADIKRAYHELARKYHPDRGGDAKNFEKIKQAYDTLIDTKKRKEYDRSLKVAATKNDRIEGLKTPHKEMREEELKRIFHDPQYTQHHYFTPRYRKHEETERAKRAKKKRCPICHGRGFVRYNVRPELGAIGIEERLCSCQIIVN